MSTSHPQARQVSLMFSVGISVFWVATYFGARLALGSLAVGDAWRVTIALVPVVPFAGFLWCVIANIRTLDEMQRKVHLEALAIAFPLAMLLLMTLGLLELAIELPADDFSYRHIWAFLPLFYFTGLAIAWRRYR